MIKSPEDLLDLVLISVACVMLWICFGWKITVPVYLISLALKPHRSK